MTHNQRRRVESRDLAWLQMRELERARFLPRELIAIKVIVIGIEELEPEPTRDAEFTIPECMR